jgi:hypothetical protein
MGQSIKRINISRPNMHSEFLFLLLAFGVPLIVRALPEILMGSYSVGFDTMGYYVPSAMLWPHGGIDLLSFLESAPLFYLFIFPILSSGISPVLLLKIIPPLLAGSLGLILYLYARQGQGWSPVKSLAPALVGTMYFVALRISWDMLRNMLSVIFLFAVLILLSERHLVSWKRYVLLSIAMLATILSDQLGAIMLFGIVAINLTLNLLHKKLMPALKIGLAFLPSAVFSIVFYLSVAIRSGFLANPATEGSSLASWMGFGSYSSMLTSELLFFLYCYLLLLPMVFISLRRFRDIQLRSWLFLCFAFLLIPFANVSPFRWLLLLIFPFGFYVAEAFTIIKSSRFKRFNLMLYRIAVIYLIISTVTLSVGFIFLTPEKPFVYFDPNQINVFQNQIPSSMLQNTVSLNDCSDTMKALEWFRQNIDNSSLLLTHSAFYGWALLILDKNRIVNYEFGDPSKIATAITQKEHTQLYLLWWVNGDGWYGMQNVSEEFQAVFKSGNMVVYSFKN